MGRHAGDDEDPQSTRVAWRDRLLLALSVLAVTTLGVVWAGGAWVTALAIGTGAAVVVVGAFVLGSTMPGPPPDSDR